MNMPPWVWVLLGVLASSTAVAEEAIPPHKPLELVGVHAYAQKSVAAGRTIRFRTSSSVPYELSICRLGPEPDDPAADEVLKTFPKSKPNPQPIYPGSYVHVSKSLAADEPIKALTLECWVRPWRLNGWESLITQYDYPTACGFGLFLDNEGHLEFYLGDGGKYRAGWVSEGPQLAHRRWQHIVGTWDGKVKSLWIDGKLVGQWPFSGPAKAGPAPLRLAACSYDGPVVNLLDGDLAMPVIYRRALSPEEIADRLTQQGLEPAEGPGVLACWTFEEERGPLVADASKGGRHGRIINEATWMIGGPSFDGGKVPRFGPYDPAKDPDRGHGLRFAGDDLYDCRWQVTEEYTIPRTARPGIYVGRYRFRIDDQDRLYHVTFIVKKAPERPKAPILVLGASTTWLAYSATSFPATPPGLNHNWGTSGIANSPGNPPAYCCYRNHQAGQPAYKVGLNKPWPSAGPYVMYCPEGVGYTNVSRSSGWNKAAISTTWSVTMNSTVIPACSPATRLW